MPWCDMFFYIHTNKYIIRWFYEMMKPQSGYMLIHVYICIQWFYDDELSWGHGDSYVVLRAPMDDLW